MNARRRSLPSSRLSGVIALLTAFFLAVALAQPSRAAVEIQEVTSPGGITAWLVEEHSIPMIAFEVHFAGGSSLDPSGKEGLANLLSGLLDEGAGDLDSQEFQRRLEDLAIGLDFDAGRDGFSGSLRTLTENRGEAFRLLRLALTEPRFDPEPVERIRAQVISGIRARENDPETIVGQTMFKRLYPDHPYGTPTRGMAESVASITVEDLRTFVQTRFARENLSIGVVGDITADELKSQLDRMFGDLPETARAPVEVPDTTAAAHGQVIVEKRPIPQSVLMWALPGIERDHPDYFAAVLMNHVLGGGSFTSRLYREIREERGLAYSVYSAIVPYEHSGLVLGGVATENSQLAESLALIRDELALMAREGVSEAELAAAKTYTTGAFPLRLDSNARIANMLITIQVLDLGIDYIDRRASIVNRVTQADVQRIARQLLDPAQMAVVVVGNPQGLAPTQ